MLVLSRKVGEAFIIHDNVRVMVVGINGGQIRLGIEAPRDMAVHREEVWQQIQREKRNGNRD